MWYVTISKEDNQPNQCEWKDLKIDDKPIKFFQAPILDKFKGYMCKSEGSELWKLTFFNHKSYSEKLFVRFSDTQPRSDPNYLFKAFWDKVSDGEPNNDQLETASQWLRGSKSICIENYVAKHGSFLFVDGRGIAVFSTKCFGNFSENCPVFFQRYILLLCLCAAYKLRIEKLINELANAPDDCTTLNQMIKESYEFSARYYFRHPVRMENTELPFVWDEIRDRMRLQEYLDEFLSQASALRHVVLEAEQEHQRLRQEKLSNLMTVALILLALLTFLEALPLFGSHP
ncbi:hypothetical protein [Acidithiobacillus sp.]|uniref:hypothetical protein n=1 Tax=Acidithiobacillus sp. TaxID=1872118 RepID=UPI0025C63A40|nr:hypothetical protein [Acidithiobacillus sp.]